MSEPTSADDDLDRLNRAYWFGEDIQARLQHVEPLRADESFQITDLTDDEWVQFMLAVRG